MCPKIYFKSRALKYTIKLGVEMCDSTSKSALVTFHVLFVVALSFSRSMETR